MLFYHLLVSRILGGIMTLAIFLLCFFLVITAKLCYLGYLHLSSQRTKPKATEATPKKQEPIYYIVEKKKKPPKAKPTYAEPRRIDFAKEDELVS